MNEDGPCSVTIFARSPLVCSISPARKLPPEEREQLLEQVYFTLNRIRDGIDHIQVLLENL